MKKQTKNILMGVGAVTLAAGAIAAYAVTVEKLVKIALHREPPKHSERGKKMITGSSKLSEVAETLLSAAAELEKVEMETVTITADDGTELIGHLYCPKTAERLIVAMHGWRSNWSQDFGLISPFWMKNNCAVLYAEQRGQGNSGGEYMGFGLLERYDCVKWTQLAYEKTGGRLPIYLCGISMGATTVLMAAGSELPNSVCGIMADCGFTSPHAIWKHVAESNLHIPYGLYSGAAKDLCRRKIQVTSDSYSTLEALEASEIPVLLIHGTDDKFVPIDMTYQNYKAAIAKKKLLVVPGAEHGLSYLTDKQSYESTMLEFWKEFDK